MQCNQCGYVLPSGAEVCPHCFSPTPYNAGTALADAPHFPPPPSGVAPTQLASAPPPPPPLGVAPTQLASTLPPPPVVAPTERASVPPPPPPVGAPGGYVPPTPPPASPYAPAGQMAAGQSGPGWVYQPSSPTWPPQAGAPVSPPVVPVAVQPQKRSGCSVAAIIVLVILLIVVCGASALGAGVWYTQRQNATATVNALNDDATTTADNATATADSATSTAMLTPTPYPPYTESNPPSGGNFSEYAQQVIASAQTAGSVDSQNRPNTLQSKFNSGDEVYLSYKWTQGYSGYVYTLWYFNGRLESDLTSRSKYIYTYNYGYGYMGATFYDSGQGAIEVYWCGKSDCSDRRLAWVRPFSVGG